MKYLSMQPWKHLFGSSSATVGSQTQVKKKKKKGRKELVFNFCNLLYSHHQMQTRTISFGFLKLRFYVLHL